MSYRTYYSHVFDSRPYPRHIVHIRFDQGTLGTYPIDIQDRWYWTIGVERYQPHIGYRS
jgi:hypothetical protein